MWDAASGRKISNSWRHAGAVLSIAFSPDRKHAATAGADQVVRIWDTETGQELRVLRGHTDSVQGISYSPDGQRLASISQDRTLRTWDPAATQEAVTISVAQAIDGLAFAPDGQKLYLLDDDGQLRLLDLVTTRQTLVSKEEAANMELPTFSRHREFVNESNVWSLDRNHKVHLERLEGVRRHQTGLGRYVLSPDCSRLAWIGEGNLIVWDADSGRAVFHVDPGMKGYEEFLSRTFYSGVLMATFSPDNKRLVIGGDKGDLKLWDAENGQEILTLRGHQAPIIGLVFSPDGRRLASASRDKTIKIWGSSVDAP
jgi:WD40 repeat protein